MQMSGHQTTNQPKYHELTDVFSVHSLSLERETSTGVLANFSREPILSENSPKNKRNLAEFKRMMPGFDQLYPGNRRN